MMALLRDNKPLLRRLRLLQIIFWVAAALFVGKLWSLSVVHFDHYDELARNNRVRTLPLLAPRGLILDREGRVLADNTPSMRLLVYRDDMLDRGATVDFIAEGLGMDADEVDLLLHKAEKRVGAFRPLELGGSLNIDQVAFFKARQAEHPEVRISRQPRRIYRFGRLAAHVLGYVGEISERELESDRFEESRPGDIVGKFGLERQYNSRLAGEDGLLRVRVNSRGKVLAEVSRQEPKQGQSLRTTLDLDLQMAAEQAMGGESGALVALDPGTGQILAAVSQPSFDPNAFAKGISQKMWEELNGPGKPLQNRVIQNAFSPGSIFKVIMAAAGLHLGVYDLDTTIYCGGAATIYGHRFRCHKAGGHGRVGIRTAIERSCNVYFYQMGRRLDIDQIHDFAARFGLGRATGVDLPGEMAGLLPSREWKRRTRGERWYSGETISVSIGQGPINVTPLQLAAAIGVAATGRTPQPHLALSSRQRARKRPPTALGEVDPAHIDAIRDGMWSAVNNWGTARAAKVEGFDVCGKTGTAQVVARETMEKLSEEKRGRFVSNAWFAGFAPRDNPEVAVAVIVQQGGGGGASAAPIAGRLFDRYYRKYHLKEKIEQPLEFAQR